MIGDLLIKKNICWVKLLPSKNSYPQKLTTNIANFVGRKLWMLIALKLKRKLIQQMKNIIGYIAIAIMILNRCLIGNKTVAKKRL
jgi:hypothetical protein